MTPLGPRLIQPARVRPLRAVDTPPVFGITPRRFVERNARQRDALVADAPQHEPARNRLGLARRARDDPAVLLDELVAHDLDRLDPFLAEDRDRRDEEAEDDPPRLARRPARRTPEQLEVPSSAISVRFQLAPCSPASSSRSCGVDDGLARRNSPSSLSSGGVNAACTGPRRPSMRISRSGEAAIASAAASIVSVGASSSAVSASIRAQSIATLPFPITTTRSRVEVEVEVLEVRVAVVPGDERGGRPRSGQVLAGDAEPAVGLRAHGVDDRVVDREQLVVRHGRADLDVAEEAEARAARPSSRTRARRP